MPTTLPPPKTLISEEIPSGGTPGAPGGQVAPVAAQISPAKADPRLEYVSGGTWNWYRSYVRTLPYAIDDISTDFGDDVYERMLAHHQVSAAVNVLRASILEDGVTVNPAVTDKKNPDYEQAVRQADWVERQWENLDPAMDDVLWDMTIAVALGNRGAELVYEDDNTYTGRQQLILKALKTKPRHSFTYVVDSFRNVLGYLAVIPGIPLPSQLSLVLGDPTQLPNFLPREKLAIFTFRPTDNDPRGTSILRPAFDPWNRAQQAKPEHLKFLSQFATPSVIGYTPPDAESNPYSDPDGNALASTYAVQVNPAAGNPATPTAALAPAGAQLTPEQAMLNVLVQWRNATAMVFPYGSQVQLVQSQGKGEAFDTAFARFDLEIVKAILNQSLATEEGAHSTRAAAGVHQDILQTIIRQSKKSLVRMLYRIARLMIRYNYGLQAERLTPKPSLGETAQTDMTATMAAVGHIGYTLDQSQMPDIDEMLGLPVRTPTAPAPAVSGAVAQLGQSGVAAQLPAIQQELDQLAEDVQ